MLIGESEFLGAGPYLDNQQAVNADDRLEYILKNDAHSVGTLRTTTLAPSMPRAATSPSLFVRP